MQNVDVGQDTRWIELLAPNEAGGLQLAPLYLNTLPLLSPAMQNEVVAHETDRAAEPAMSFGELHEVPLYVHTLPFVLAAAQNEESTHDSELRLLLSATGVLHALPL